MEIENCNYAAAYVRVKNLGACRVWIGFIQDAVKVAAAFIVKEQCGLEIVIPLPNKIKYENLVDRFFVNYERLIDGFPSKDYLFNPIFSSVKDFKLRAPNELEIMQAHIFLNKYKGTPYEVEM